MAASPHAVSLVGPPEIKHPVIVPATVAPPAPTEPKFFLDMLKLSMVGQGLPPLGLTENNSATFLKSGNACLDFFFKVVPDIDKGGLESLLQEAWGEDALMALKLIFQLRGVRGTGKSDKTNFYAAALWLHKYHPKTLIANAR